MTKHEKELKRIALHQAICKASKEHNVLMMVQCTNALKVLDTLPIDEDIFAATHELSQDDKVNLYHRMMAMYCMSDVLESLSVDFEDSLQKIAPKASTSTRLVVEQIRKSTHSLVHTIDKQFSEALAEDYGDVCDELAAVINKFIDSDERIKGITDALIEG